MEFHEKLQELRKQKGLTQEELAQVLYVSRTAVSKWESGRGYPNLDSLKALSKFFSVSIDDLLSGDEVLTIAEEDQKQTKARFCTLVFGLLDCSVILCFLLPLFRQQVSGTISAVSLLSLSGIEPYVKLAYLGVITLIAASGLLTLALRKGRFPFWEARKDTFSLVLTALGTVLFIISSQPYAATLLLVFLLIKGFLQLKNP